MTYTPINWQTGDTITAEKLNRCDNGWSVTSGTITFANETITTELDGDINFAELTTTQIIDSDSVKVTFDNTEYNCPNLGSGNASYYGAAGMDYSTYPFCLYYDGYIECETGGSHTVEVEGTATSIDTSDNFTAAVQESTPLLRIVQGTTTWQQVYDAIAAGMIACYFTEQNDQALAFFAQAAYLDDSDDKYRVFCNDANLTLSANSPNSALFAE